MKTRHIFGAIFWLIAILPLSGVSLLTSNFLISFPEIFLILIFSLYALSNPTIGKTYLLTAIILVIFLSLSLMLNVYEGSLFNLSKDLKPYFFFIGTLLCVGCNKRDFPKYNLNFVIAVIIIGDILTYAFLMSFPEFMPEGIRKESFIRSGFYRYTDSMVVFVQALILINFYKNQHRPLQLNIGFLFFLLVSLLTQDRAFILFGMSYYLYISLKRLNLLSLFFVIPILFTLIAYMSFYLASENTLRFSGLLNFEMISEEVFARVILPAVNGGYDFTAKTLLIGAGLDFKFFIPWFEYRGLNIYHSSLDSFYTTFFIKHGIFGLSLFVVSFFLIVREQAKVFILFIFTYLLVHNGPYISDFLLMLFYISFVGKRVDNDV